MRKNYDLSCKFCGKSPIREKAVVKRQHYNKLPDKCMSCGELQKK